MNPDEVVSDDVPEGDRATVEPTEADDEAVPARDRMTCLISSDQSLLENGANRAC